MHSPPQYSILVNNESNFSQLFHQHASVMNVSCHLGN